MHNLTRNARGRPPRKANIHANLYNHPSATNDMHNRWAEEERIFLRRRQEEVAQELHYSISTSLKEYIENCASPVDPSEVPRNNIKYARRSLNLLADLRVSLGK